MIFSFDSFHEVSRILSIMCIRILPIIVFVKPWQNQLVHTFPLHLHIMVWYFPNNSNNVKGGWFYNKWGTLRLGIYLFIITVEKHMVMHVQSLFESINPDKNTNVYHEEIKENILYIISWNKYLVYSLSFTNEFIINLLTPFYERLM